MSEFHISYTGEELDSAINAVKNNYVDKRKMFRMATGIVTNVTAGQELTVTGILDEKTDQPFDVKGVFACIEPTTTTNYSASGDGKPGLLVIYNANSDAGTVIVATYSAKNTVRAGCRSTRLTMSGNSFSIMADTSMYGVVAASKWRWIAWG